MLRIGKLGVATTVLALGLLLVACPARDEEPEMETETTVLDGAAVVVEEGALLEEGTGVYVGDEPLEPGTPVQVVPESEVARQPAPPGATRPAAPAAESPRVDTPPAGQPAAPAAAEPTPPSAAPEPAPARTAPAAPTPAPAAAEPAGREIYLAQNCQRCHSVSTAGIEAKAKTGPTAGGDLSASDVDRAALRTVIADRQLAEKRHPGRFTGSPGELDALIDWLLAQRR